MERYVVDDESWGGANWGGGGLVIFLYGVVVLFLVVFRSWCSWGDGDGDGVNARKSDRTNLSVIVPR